MKLNKIELKKTHKNLFGIEHSAEVISPSRINIIGEHIDYLGGNVLPANIDLQMIGLFNKSNDIQVYSENFKSEGIKVIPKNNTYIWDEKNGFANYVAGCIQILKNENYPVNGLKMSVSSNIPPSSGLSSSAAFGVMIILGLSKLYDLKLFNKQIAILFKKVENEFMNLKNGIMDQFIIACGEKNKIMLLNTSTLEYQNYSADLKDFTFVVFNTKKPRDLVDSKYNERVEETTQALKDINIKNSFKSICAIPFEERHDYIKLVKDVKGKKRVQYAIEEQHRVKSLVEHMVQKDYAKVGDILNQGHIGLRDLYEVSCKELDFIQEYANRVEGVLGARMTGAGFGGCLIVLVNKANIDKLEKYVKQNYEKVIGYKCEMYLVNIAEHAK